MSKLFIALTSLIVIISFNSTALACACCADRGTYSVWTTTLADYEKELLKDMKFGKKAEFYETPAAYDETRGLSDLVVEWQNAGYEAPNIVDAYLNEIWRLDFTSRDGKRGSLVLPRPNRMTTRRVHIPDNKSTAVEPLLYKEFIFNGTVRSGTGFFKNGIVAPTKYTLIFQGHGNNCHNAEDFTNWRLEITGKRADYAFFGMTEAGEKEVPLDTTQ